MTDINLVCSPVGWKRWTGVAWVDLVGPMDVSVSRVAAGFAEFQRGARRLLQGKKPVCVESQHDRANIGLEAKGGMSLSSFPAKRDEVHIADFGQAVDVVRAERIHCSVAERIADTQGFKTFQHEEPAAPVDRNADCHILVPLTDVDLRCGDFCQCDPFCDDGVNEADHDA